MILQSDHFAGARILLVGDVMLDRYWSGGTDRISPEAPVPVVGLRDFRDQPGGAANVALNVSALGATATLVGLTGADDAAVRLRTTLDATAVRHHLIEVPGSPTITKLRILSRNQHLMRLDIEDGYAEADHAPLVEQCRSLLSSSDVLLLSDYAKGTLEAVTGDLIDMGRAAGIPVLVDPKGGDFARYRGASLLTPNRGEFERVVGPCADDAELDARARTLIADLELDGILITRSDEGMTLVPSDGESLHLAAHRREVYDVTGAGDTVIGVLAAALAAGDTLADATMLANHAAAIVVGHLGAAQVTPDELRDALERADRVGDSGGVVSRTQLVERVGSARARGERIVMTNGCFDLLHVGHLESLREMRTHGDRLIVAVNDDDSVRRLKGEARPVVPLDQRMAMLAALDCVDWVVDFSEDTPAALIEAVAPDVLAKGGDYRPDEIAGSEAVQACGGSVVVVPYRQGLSTSELIARIRSDAVQDGGG